MIAGNISINIIQFKQVFINDARKIMEIYTQNLVNIYLDLKVNNEE